MSHLRIQHSSEGSGSARFGAGRARAIDAARRALAIDPRNAAALTALSQTGSGELSMVEALPLVDRALAVDPEYPAALMSSAAGRSEERRVGKACVSTCRYRWSPYHSTNT